jgi:type IV fimbrial biogenesis protein FimT
MAIRGRAHVIQSKGKTKTIDSQQQGTDKRTSHTGITVVELLIGFTVIAIIALVAAPGLSGLLRSQQIGNAASELARSLSLAKNEAGKRHSTVRVCPSSDGLSCRQDGDWNRGWLIFSDGNGDGSPQEFERIRAYDPPNENIRVKSSGAVTNVAAFTVAGLVENNASEKGEFTVCHVDSNSDPKKILVDSEGWVSLAKGDSAACLDG